MRSAAPARHPNGFSGRPSYSRYRGTSLPTLNRTLFPGAISVFLYLSPVRLLNLRCCSLPWIGWPSIQLLVNGYGLQGPSITVKTAFLSSCLYYLIRNPHDW